MASLELLLPGFGAPPEHRIRRNAEGIMDAEELVELVEQRQREAGAPRRFLTSGNATCKRGTGRSSMGTMRAWQDAFPGRSRAASRQPVWRSKTSIG
jgi:hypothetical protein